MLLELILAGTFISAILSTTCVVITTIINNKSKKNEAIKLFKYTKLYEIISDLKSQDKLLHSEVTDTGEIKQKINFSRIDYLYKSYSLAKPFLNALYYDSLDELVNNIYKSRNEFIESKYDNNKRIVFIESVGEFENKFEEIVHGELLCLLNGN